MTRTALNGSKQVSSAYASVMSPNNSVASSPGLCHQNRKTCKKGINIAITSKLHRDSVTAVSLTTAE